MRNDIVLIDRDGTINKKIKKKKYITSIKQIKLNTSLINILKKFKNIKYICITNQACVSKKLISKKKLDLINSFIKTKLKAKNINIIKFYVSCANTNSNHFNRKPNPGLFKKASKEYNFKLKNTFYIGDDERDIIASQNAKTKCFFLGRKEVSKNYRHTVLKNNLSYYLKKKNHNEIL